MLKKASENAVCIAVDHKRSRFLHEATKATPRWKLPNT